MTNKCTHRYSKTMRAFKFISNSAHCAFRLDFVLMLWTKGNNGTSYNIYNDARVYEELRNPISLLFKFAMSDITYPLFPIFAFFGFILPLIPLRWHLEALNSGTCYFIFWSSLASLNLFINSILWANHALNLAPGWCEICKAFLVVSVDRLTE